MKLPNYSTYMVIVFGQPPPKKNKMYLYAYAQEI